MGPVVQRAPPLETSAALLPSARVGDKIGKDERRADARRHGDGSFTSSGQANAVRSGVVRAGGKVSGPTGAAQLLGLRPTTLDSRIRALGLRGVGRRRGHGEAPAEGE